MNNTNTIIVFLACIMAIIIFGKIFIIPLKKIVKLIINSILGGSLIIVINWIGAIFNFHIGLNIFTAIFVRNIGYSGNYTINYF
ncbi:MAG: pro-sigmaK processing inhibitor BofA family protein [Clostridia bacterium]|nr:pro-sigmaK processing inhibitor BofA family protein [Clostridia bacterium]